MYVNCITYVYIIISYIVCIILFLYLLCAQTSIRADLLPDPDPVSNKPYSVRNPSALPAAVLSSHDLGIIHILTY